MTKPYQWRGTVPLKPDDHALWACVQKRVAQKWPWEQIAVEIGCHVDDLIHWVNWVYQPPKRPKAKTVEMIAREARSAIRADEGLPRDAPSRSAQFMAWKRVRDGARATRERLQA